MARFEIVARYPFFRRISEDEVARLKSANTEQREKLQTAQQLRLRAEKQAEEARKSREKLYAKLASTQQELSKERKDNERLRGRISQLQEELRQRDIA